MTAALSIQQVSCQYDGISILKELSIDVEAGEIICLLGSSGCGKTTLLKAISGLLPLSAGTIHLNEQLIDDYTYHCPPEDRHIGMIFQDYALFPHLTVAQNVAFGLTDLSKQQRNDKIIEMLELVHLDEFAQRYPHQLSGGQQQRVAIARALAYQPQLLLLDEPFSNIDTQVRYELITEIRKLFKQRGITAIFVSHSREEAFAFADKMAVMNQGVIEQYGHAAHLYTYPSSSFVADFLGGGSYLSATCVVNKESFDANIKESNLVNNQETDAELKGIAESEKFMDHQTDLGVIRAYTPITMTAQQPCKLLLRPQQVLVTLDPTSHISILARQFMGDHWRYTINVGDDHLLAISPQAIAASALAVGDKVTVTLDSQHVTAFPLL